MKVTTTMTGDLTANLKNLPNAVSRKVQIAALKTGAEPIRNMATSLAPRDEDSGGEHLADNIVISVPSETQLEESGIFDLPAVEIGPARRFFYGFFGEFGTAHEPARSWFRPAFDSQSRRSLVIVGAEAWAAIRKFVGVGGSRSGTGGNL